jgi:hypothetical protein
MKPSIQRSGLKEASNAEVERLTGESWRALAKEGDDGDCAPRFAQRAQL